MESKINPDVLERFKEARATKTVWKTDDSHEALYRLWITIVEDECGGAGYNAKAEGPEKTAFNIFHGPTGYRILCNRYQLYGSSIP